MFGAIIDNQAFLISENGKSIIRKVGRKGPYSVQANRMHFVILYRNGTVRVYRSQSGSDRGQIGRDKAINISLRGDYLLISYDNGQRSKHNLKKLAYASKGNPIDRVKARIAKKVLKK